MLEERIDGQAGRQSEAWKAEESFEVEDSRKNGWFWSYDAIFDLDISEHAKIVYLDLCRRAGKNGKAIFSHARIARDCSICVRTVQKAIDELIQAGLIRVISRKQQGLNNIYRLMDLSEWRGGAGTQVYPGNWEGVGRGNIPPRGRSAPHADPSAPHADPSAPHADIGLHYRTTQKDSLSERKFHAKGEGKREGINGGRELPHPEQPASESPFAPLVRYFYAQLGQPQVSREKVEEGAKVIANLESQGFSIEQITWGMEWIVRNQGKFDGEVYSLCLLPKVIGQALKEAEKVKRAEEKRQQQEEEERRLREEQTRRVALEELYLSLPAAEQASLREKAQENLIQQGIQKPLLLETLVKGEICRLLGDGSHLASAVQSVYANPVWGGILHVRCLEELTMAREYWVTCVIYDHRAPLYQSTEIG